MSRIHQLPEPTGPGRDLLVALRDLHLRAGEPSTREIARATGGALSHDTVHRTLRGSGLSRWRPLELIVKALEGDVEAFRTLWVSAEKDSDEGETGVSQLTAREKEIITLTAQGMASSAIAETLELSTRTVENHLFRIYKKLGVNSKPQLASVAVSTLGVRPVSPFGGLPGRADELALLDGYLRELTRGSGNAVLIEGEPGIGKTTLVRTALADLPTGSCQVFWGKGDELSQEIPLSPFLDAFGVRRPSQNARRVTIAGLLRGEVATDRGADVPALLAEQLIALTVDETSARPLALVIDDLQWADPASVKLWGRLARTAYQVPLLLIGLTRPVPHREDLLALRRVVGSESRVQLAALSQPAVAELVGELAGGRPDSGLLRLAEGAAGNPLYLTELLAALNRSGGIVLTASGTAQLAAETVPGSLPAAIADRLDFVSAATKSVLAAAALLGVEFAIPDLTTILGRTMAELGPALDEARTVGVLVDAWGGVGLAFRHPLIREALYGELPVAVRSAWHRDAGHSLAAAGAAPDRVARQLLRAVTQPTGNAGRSDLLTRGQAGADHGMDVNMAGSPAAGIERPSTGPGALRPPELMDEWMLEWLAVSADSLIGQAPGVAAELLAQAVESIPPGSFRHGWLASKLADALYRTGDRTGAEQVATRALAQTTDPDLLVDLHWTLTQCSLLTGHTAETFAAVEQVLASPGLTGKHRARLRVLAARSHLALGDLDAARHEAESALASATEIADTWGVGWALHVLATMALIRGELADALPLYDRALAVAETDPALADLGLLLQINKAVALFNLDRCDEALATAGQARQRADQVGTAVRVAQAHGVLGQALYAMGRWDDALTEIVIVPEHLKEPFAACGELAIAAGISFHRNEPDTARSYLAAAQAHGQRIGHRTVLALALARSLDREQAGMPDDALAVLAAAIEADADDLGDIEDLLADAVRLALKTGDKTAAQTLTRQAGLLAEETDIPHRQANALYCQGLMERDASALLTAAQLYADASRPLPQAKALEAAAECLIEADERTDARQAFEHAIEVYESLGAHMDLDRIQGEFRAYGVRRGPHSKHRRAVSGWDSLTDIELKIAAWVEEGLSNPEIAARLMLSRRTVATQVSHILKKLNVTTRTDIARESALRAIESA